MHSKKLDNFAFGLALGTTCLVVHAILWVGSAMLPKYLFFLVFNAQFFGANVAALYTLTHSLGQFLISLMVFTLSGFLVGYFWAFVYNRFAK